MSARLLVLTAFALLLPSVSAGPVDDAAECFATSRRPVVDTAVGCTTGCPADPAGLAGCADPTGGLVGDAVACLTAHRLVIGEDVHFESDGEPIVDCLLGLA